MREKKMNESYLIVGLGNPGTEYAVTRHNVGWLALDYIADRFGITIKKLKFKSKYGETFWGTHKIILLKPQTFMNSSGIAVAEAAEYYNIPPERVIVLCDDISLPANKLRIRRKGSAGGHNGLKSIINMLESDMFPRIKIGVADRTDGRDLADWVLGKIPDSDLKILKERFSTIYGAICDIVDGNMEKAMADCNTEKEQENS